MYFLFFFLIQLSIGTRTSTEQIGGGRKGLRFAAIQGIIHNLRAISDDNTLITLSEITKHVDEYMIYNLNDWLRFPDFLLSTNHSKSAIDSILKWTQIQSMSTSDHDQTHSMQFRSRKVVRKGYEHHFGFGQAVKVKVDGDGRIIIIDLSRLRLTDNEIGEISKLPPTLKRLYLGGNKLTTFDVSALPQGLELLDLCNNQLCNTNLKGLPPHLSKLGLINNPLDNVQFTLGAFIASLRFMISKSLNDDNTLD